MPPKAGTKSGAKAKGPAKPKGLTKSQLMAVLAEAAGLSKKQVGEVFEALSATIADELKAGRPFTIPGLAKIVLQHKKATPARPGISPFTKEPIVIKAKPARKVVRVRPVKALKDMA